MVDSNGTNQHSTMFNGNITDEDGAPDLDEAQQAHQQPAAANANFGGEAIVQVVYQRHPNGSILDVESSALLQGGPGEPLSLLESVQLGSSDQERASQSRLDGGHLQLSRAASTLPSVAEESTSSAMSYPPEAERVAFGQSSLGGFEDSSQHGQLCLEQDCGQLALESRGADQEAVVYASVSKPLAARGEREPMETVESGPVEATAASVYSNLYEQTGPGGLGGELGQQRAQQQLVEFADEDFGEGGEQKENAETELVQVLSRQKSGAVESGSFRNNFRKKLGLSASTNENDLTAYRRKLIESRESAPGSGLAGAEEGPEVGGQLSKFKRTHSVSFNVGASRSSRHSVDIRNLPSYLTHKRASIVDVAKGAMTSLMSSLGGGGGSGSGSSISAGQRRDSSAVVAEEEEEPIFEEPIAPTLSLGQRVALVRSSGAEFGTVGWIGQLPGVEDDWIVGVIFDNMIGNCDGAHEGVRYFYARQNYAMFLPLSALTKTDNYIGRPETGTMLSRMSVSLKPGQLISIQRSSIRLQHCFLNAPHQRVGHDVRAVSNRLHCQCHNCGPCAHLTKQGRLQPMAHHFGSRHLAHHKKNSLAHAAVEMLAHHHHHFHDEEEHEEEDYQFGDNAAHACNFVRYSCCQQSGLAGHQFSSDCQMVRPELLDNLIHAPKAPHRRSRPRKLRRAQQQQQRVARGAPLAPIGSSEKAQLVLEEQQATAHSTDGSHRSLSPSLSPSSRSPSPFGSGSESASGSSSTCSTCRSSPVPIYNYYPAELPAYQNGAYSTINSQISLMDQRMFISQRNSSAFIQSHHSDWSDDLDRPPESITKSILRCLGCLRRRKRPGQPKRKLSARDKVIEYRRKQSTFVPSTLAKPHEDFASHGIILPGAGVLQADFKSNRSSSPASAQLAHEGEQLQADVYGTPNPNDQLRCPPTTILQADQDELSQKSLTDLGFWDTFKTDSSSDTLKQLVDQEINEQVSPPEPIEVSLITPTEGNSASEQVDVSSPTASVVGNADEDVRRGLEDFKLNSDDETSSP